MQEYKLQRRPIKSLRNTAYDEIKEAILSNGFPPGSKLIEADLADQMGISRGPVREALRLLESDGLVKSEPYKGTIVSQRSEEEASLVYTPIRRIIERYAWLKAHEMFGDEDYDFLTKDVEKLEEALKTRDIDAASRIDGDFHRYIVSHCTSDMLTSLWNSLSAHFLGRMYYQNRVQVQQNAPSLQWIPDDHKEVLEAIRSGNEEKIDRLILKHIV